METTLSVLVLCHCAIVQKRTEYGYYRKYYLKTSKQRYARNEVKRKLRRQLFGDQIRAKERERDRLKREERLRLNPPAPKILQTKEERLAYKKAYREKNAARLAEKKRLWYQENRERLLAKSNAHGKANRHLERERLNKRYATEPQFKMARRFRNRVYQMLRMGHKHCRRLNLNASELVAHLESLFLPGMTWENHGTVWHVDHRKPCASFDLTDPAQVKECFALSNLQPLWAKVNIRKGAKLDWNEHVDVI